MKRKNNKGIDKNHFDERELDFYKRMRQGYLDFFEKVPSVTINADLPIEKVNESVLAEINNLM